MLDRDLAEMYGVETRVLNQAVKRNIERFPDDFMFQLTKEDTRAQLEMINEMLAELQAQKRAGKPHNPVDYQAIAEARKKNEEKETQ